MPNELDISDAEIAEPASGQVVVKIRYCGVCGTDVHGFAAPEMLPPAVFGHEWTGTVSAIGPEVGSVRVGQRVTVAVGPPAAGAPCAAPATPSTGRPRSPKPTASPPTLLPTAALRFSEAIREATDGLGADVVFECTGVAALLQPSAALVRRGGTLSLLGYPITESSVSYGDWQSRELRVVGSLAYSHEDFLGAMRAVASGAVDVAPLITGTVGLGGLADVLTDLGSGKTNHAKVLVDPER